MADVLSAVNGVGSIHVSREVTGVRAYGKPTSSMYTIEFASIVGNVPLLTVAAGKTNCANWFLIRSALVAFTEAACIVRCGIERHATSCQALGLVGERNNITGHSGREYGGRVCCLRHWAIGCVKAPLKLSTNADKTIAADTLSNHIPPNRRGSTQYPCAMCLCPLFLLHKLYR